MKLALMLAISLVAAGCAAEPTVQIGGEQFNLRIANTPNARQLG